MPMQLCPIPRPASAEIFIGIEPPTPEERSSNRPKDLIIPQLVIQQPSPTREKIPVKLLGSPPPQRANIPDISIFVTDEDIDNPQQKM